MLGVTVQSQVPVVANAEFACGTKLMNRNKSLYEQMVVVQIFIHACILYYGIIIIIIKNKRREGSIVYGALRSSKRSCGNQLNSV